MVNKRTPGRASDKMCPSLCGIIGPQLPAWNQHTSVYIPSIYFSLYFYKFLFVYLGHMVFLLFVGIFVCLFLSFFFLKVNSQTSINPKIPN